MSSYPIKYRKEGKRKGWVILRKDGMASNDFYFKDKADAIKKREVLVAFYGGEQ